MLPVTLLAHQSSALHRNRLAEFVVSAYTCVLTDETWTSSHLSTRHDMNSTPANRQRFSCILQRTWCCTRFPCAPPLHLQRPIPMGVFHWCIGV